MLEHLRAKGREVLILLTATAMIMSLVTGVIGDMAMILITGFIGYLLSVGEPEK